MIDMFELLRPLSGIVPVLLILGLGYWLWRRRNRRLFGDELQPLGDPTRYALAAAVLEGSPFRRRVTDIARHPFRARAPEIGLDFPLLLAASERWERQDRALNWAIALLLLYAFAISRGLSFVLYFIFGYSETWENANWLLIALVPFALLAVIVLVIVKAVRDERRLKALRRDTYDAAKLRAELGADSYQAAAPGPRDNVICYGTREPFRGLGERANGWQVAIEIDRASGNPLLPLARNGNGHAAPGPVNAAELLSNVDRSVMALAIPNLQLHFPLFVSGTEVWDLKGPLLADRFARPAAVADGETLGRYWYFTDPRARSYRCYMITDWNGELVFSYLLRFVQRGQSLAIETTQLVLAPIDPRYRRIDAMLYRGLLGWIFWFFRVVARTPLTIWGACVGAAYHLGEMIGLVGISEADERREVQRNPAYNYGARLAIREHLASRYYNAHFQFIDGRQYFKAIDQRVLNAIADSLQAAGIDISSLVAQAQIVINGSVNLTDNSVSIANSSGAFNFGNVGAGTAFGAGAQVGANQARGGGGR